MNLCFDLDDTLYDCKQPFKKAMADFFPEKVDSIDLDQANSDYRALGDSYFNLMQQKIITADDSGILRIFNLAKRYGLDLDVIEAADFQDAYKKYQYEMKLSLEYQNFFENFKGKLAILTNGQSVHQKKKAHNLGVENYFDKQNIFASSDLSVSKPDPKAFLEVFEAMREDPEDWYYIGDNYINDMEPAKKIGMKTIHMNRHHQKSGPAADYEVHSEKELISLFHFLEQSEQTLHKC